MVEEPRGAGGGCLSTLAAGASACWLRKVAQVQKGLQQGR